MRVRTTPDSQNLSLEVPSEFSQHERGSPLLQQTDFRSLDSKDERLQGGEG